MELTRRQTAKPKYAFETSPASFLTCATQCHQTTRSAIVHPTLCFFQLVKLLRRGLERRLQGSCCPSCSCWQEAQLVRACQKQIDVVHLQQKWPAAYAACIPLDV